MLRSLREEWGQNIQPHLDVFLFKYLHFVLIIIGLGSLVSWLFVDGPENPQLKQLLLTTGSAIFVGGVFSAFVKSSLFTRQFKKAVEDVVFAEQLIADRQDLQTIWERITYVLNGRRFPQIKDDLHKIILTEYFPRSKNFYYKDVVESLMVNKLLEGGTHIELEHNDTFTIVPHDGAGYVNYRYHYIHSPSGQQVIERFLLNGRSISGYEQYREKSDDENEYIFNLPSRTYTVERRTVKKVPLNADSFLKKTYSSFVSGVRVQARSKVDGIAIRFVSVGTDQNFSSVVGNGDDWKDVMIMEYNKLLLPRQGWLVIFLRVPPLAV